MHALQSSTLMPLHYRHGFHSRLGYLNKLLRYFLGNLLLRNNVSMRIYELIRMIRILRGQNISICLSRSLVRSDYIIHHCEAMEFLNP